MRVRVRRVLAISAIGLVVLVVAAALMLHTNAVQSRILAWSIEELERRFDLDLTADDLHYNLVARRVTMTNVRLAAKGQRDRPFFAAKSVTVQLPWAVYRGQLRFDSIDVEEGRVLVHRNARGVSNLPATRPRDPNARPRRIDVRGLTVRNLEFMYRDEQRDIEVFAPQVRTDLAYVIGEGASGPFAIGGDLIVRFGKRRVVVEPVTGNAVFDSTNLELGNVRLKTVEGTIAVNGTITRVLDQPTLDLTLNGTADIERSAIWAPAPVRVAGTARIEGTMKGAPSQFVMDTRVFAPTAVVGDERRVEIDAFSRLTPNGLTLSKAILHPATGGEVVAAAEVPFGRTMPWWLTANYSGLDAATAFRLAETSPLPFGAAIRGTARLDARPGQPFRLEVHNTSAPRAARGTAPLSGTIEFFVEGNRWQANQQQRIGATAVSGRIGGFWNRRAVSRSTFDGRLEVRTSDVADAVRTAALFGFAAPDIIRNSRGPVEATVNLSGPFTSPRFVGVAQSGGVDIPSLGRTAFSANFDASERAINLTNIDARVGTARVRGEYLANLQTRRIGGSIAIDATSAGDLLTALPEALRLDGPLSANATLSGTIDTPVIAADVSGRGMTLAGQPVDTLTAKARLVGDDLLIEALTLTQGSGSLTASGRYSIAKRTYSVDLQGQELQWRGTLARLGNATARFSLRFAGSGSVDRPTGEGTINFAVTGGEAGALIGSGSGSVRLDGTTAFVTASVPALGASIDAKVATSRPFVYTAQIAADKVPLEQVIRLAGLREGHVRGTASLTATASGTLTDLVASRVSATLQEVAAAVDGLPVTLAAPSRLTWDGRGLTIDSLNLGVGRAGQLRASGRLSGADFGRANFEATFSGELGDLLRVGRLLGVPPQLEASGPVVMTARSSGGIEHATGTIRLTDGRLTWEDLPTITDLTVDAAFDSATLEVTRLTGSWQGGGIEGTASIPRGVLQGVTGSAPVRPGFAKLRVVGLNEQALAPWLPPDVRDNVRGRISGTLDATIASASLDGVSGQILLDAADLVIAGVPVKLTAPSRLALDGRVVATADPLNLSVGQTGQLQATARLSTADLRNAAFDANFTGELGELLRIGRPFGVPSQLEASGPVVITARSAGGLGDMTGTIQLAGGAVSWERLPTVTGLTIDATFDSATLEVTRLTGSWQGGGIEGTASIPRGVLQGITGPAPAQAGFAKLRLVGLTEQVFAPWLPRATLANIGAHMSATLDATITRASLDGVTGQLTLNEANFIVGGVPVTQVRPSVFAIDGGVIAAKDVVLSFGGFTAAATVQNAPAGVVPGGGELTITGSARVAPSDKAALDFEIRGDADLRVLSAFAPTVAVDGTAKVNIGIGGSPSTPILSGRVDVAGTEVLIREPRIVLADLNGTVAFDGRRVLFDNFSGTANGGELVLEGGFLLTGMRPTGGALTVQVQRAALEYPEGLQSESDALLTLRPDETGWNLIGDIIVDRSVFNEPISIAALAAARQTRAPSPPDEEGRLRDLRLNVFVTTREDLRVDNNYARMEAGAAIRLVGPADQPVVGGRITLREGGEVYLAGRTFHVARGSISFTNPNRIDPEFDVELQTRASGTDISLTLSGPMDRLQTEVRSSDPDVDSREAMAMLFGDLAGEDAITLLSAELLGATGRRIGLDTLRVERGFDTDEFRADPGLIFTETDPSTRLTLSKRLRADVEVTLSQSLRESGGLSAVVSYKPRRNIELRFISRDNLDRAVALRHEITFGGSTLTGSTRPPQPEVSAITFTGDLRRPEEDLRAKLSLDVGEEFDFYRWQRDMDDIRDEYQELGYYEVRIRGSRQPSEDDRTVALNFNITPGPIAELQIVGHQLERELEEEIREAWRRTIFDRFLIEDVQARIRRHLVAEDLVGSLVQATVALSTPERKVLRVSVEAGTAVESRDVEFSGNATFDAGDLEAVISEAGAEVDGWLEPDRIEQAIERHYRNNGFLEASVDAGRPQVIGRTARLPVTITEGRRYVLEAIMFPGVHTDRQVGAARAADLELGMPYVTTDLEAARRRVQDFYAQFGFNTASVEIEPVPDSTEGVVDVSFVVKEGPQQIVREVVTEGANETREGVITGALRIDPGEPVNLARWSVARKRLYDTNVFRQVDIEAVPVEATAEETAAGVQPVRAVVRVIEYPVWRLRYGLQLNDEKTSLETDPVEERQQNLGILADVRNQNLFGRAITAGLAGRFERDRRSESIFLSNSSFFGLPLRSNAFIFDARQQFRTDNVVYQIQDRRGLSAEQRWRPSRRVEVTYGYRYERINVSDPRPDNPGEPPRVPLIFNISKLTTAAYIDRRDDPFQPSRGWFSSANWDQALEFLGSDFRTSKLLVQQLYFRSLNRLVLAARAQVGAEFSTADLPSSERFQLGGATTVRGYAENSLGPFDPVTATVGGDGLLLFNAEARFPVRGWVQGVAFVDAGNVFEGKRDTSLGDLKVGYGIGLRLASPFAMLRVDFGIPATAVRPGEPKPKGRFYIGIGHIF